MELLVVALVLLAGVTFVVIVVLNVIPRREKRADYEAVARDLEKLTKGKTGTPPASASFGAEIECTAEFRGPPSLARVRHFYSNAVGVYHDNDVGSSRQAIIRKCRRSESVKLVHDHRNRHDRNATMVCRNNGQQIGFLNRDLAKQFVRQSSEGYRFVAFIKEILSRTSDKDFLGVRLLIIVGQPGATDAEVQDYINGIDVAEDDYEDYVVEDDDDEDW